VDFALAKTVAAKVVELYAAGQVDAVYAIYNEFKSVLTQRLMIEKLLPVEPEQFLREKEERPGRGAAGPGHAAGGSGAEVDYIYEQPPEEVLGMLLPRHVETQVYRVLCESAAAEHAARMTAMDAATNNAGELIDRLTLHITKEIIEVVSGAASPSS
jgi:F-type H+-transporting ATPase subunit gamma